MKKKGAGVKEVDERLTRKQLRAVETLLGVFLDVPKRAIRSVNQQFGVYDEDEAYVSDIKAEGKFFTAEELQNKIKAAFR